MLAGGSSRSASIATNGASSSARSASLVPPGLRAPLARRPAGADGAVAIGGGEGREPLLPLVPPARRRRPRRASRSHAATGRPEAGGRRGQQREHVTPAQGGERRASSRASSVRPATRSASGTSVTPFQGRRAASRCSTSSRPYGAPGAYTTATRSSGMPSSAARDARAAGRRGPRRPRLPRPSARRPGRGGRPEPGREAAVGSQRRTAPRCAPGPVRRAGATRQDRDLTVLGQRRGAAAPPWLVTICWGRRTTSGPTSDRGHCPPDDRGGGPSGRSRRTSWACSRAVTRASMATTAAARASLWARRCALAGRRDPAARGGRGAAPPPSTAGRRRVRRDPVPRPGRPGRRSPPPATRRGPGPDRASVGPASSSASRYRVTRSPRRPRPAPGQRPPGGHAGVVRGDDDGDRPERLARLGPRHGGRQRVDGGRRRR